MIEIIKWDSEFFGRKIGRLAAVPPDTETLKRDLDDAVREKFAYLTCRLGAGEIGAVHGLENHGFYLTDIGIIWEKRPFDLQAPQVSVREGTLADAEAVRKITAGLFKDGRFYHDPFFTQEEADRLYQAWAENSFKGQADKVFLVNDKGFITCKVSGDVGNIPLVGVGVPYQGQGIGTALLQAASKWFLEMKVRLITVRTQAGNGNAIKFYGRNGFYLKCVDITMAKIFSN